MRRVPTILTCAALAALGGCAPVAFGGPGARIAITPQGELQLQSAACTLPGISSQWASIPGAAGAASSSTFGVMSYVKRIQARYSLGAQQMRRDPESWKRVAGGEC
jgi:hypothetical protein